MSKLEKLSSEIIYKGRIFDVRADLVREGDAEYKRDVVVHPGSIVIAAMFADETIALVSQYRHPAEKTLLELPAGSLEPGEDHLTGALRELEEEIGYTAAKCEKIAEFYVSPGFLSEKMYLYLATELTQTAQNLDEDEFITVQRIPITKAVEMTQNGQIEDAKTMVGVLLTASRFLKEAH